MGKEKRLVKFLKSKGFIAIIIAVVFLAAAVPLSYIYYNKWLDIPNFASPKYNFMTVSGNEAKPGEVLTYEISLKNSGRVPARNIYIETAIPQNTNFVEGDYKYLKDVEDSQVTFFIDSLGTGQEIKVSYQVETRSPLDNGTIISNGGFSLKYSRERFQDTITKYFEANLETEVKSQIDFTGSYYKITDRNGEYIRMGDMLNAVFFLKNKGDMVAREILLDNLIPQNTEFVNNSFDSNGDAYLDSIGDKVVVRIDELENDSDLLFRYSLKVKSGLEDKAAILFEPTIRASEEQEVFEEKEFLVRSFPDLVDFSFRSADENGGDLLPGEIVRYSVSFRNDGDGIADGLLLKNIIPANTSFIDGSFGGGSVEQSGDTLNVSLPQLKPGEEYSCSYRVRLAGGLSYGTNLTAASTLIYGGEEIDSGSITRMVVSNYSYTVAVMGDSQVARTGWVGILNSMFEQRYVYGDFRFIKSGKGGETVVMGYNRMINSGILGQNPYLFIINYGTNDADISLGGYRTSPESFRYYLTAMVSTIKANTNAMVVVMSTGPQNEAHTHANVNSSLRTINTIAAQVCAQNGAVFVDVFNPMLQTGNPNQFLSDGLHYNGNGDHFVATVAFSTISRYLNRYGTK